MEPNFVLEASTIENFFNEHLRDVEITEENVGTPEISENAPNDFETFSSPSASKVTVRLGSKKRNKRKRRRAKQGKQKMFNLNETPTVYEVVFARTEKLKSILRAARRISSNARRSRSTAKRRSAKTTRFVNSPDYFDITPRAEKEYGVVKMPEPSPTKSRPREIQPKVELVALSDEDASLFEDLPFTEDRKTEEIYTNVRKRRSSTKFHKRDFQLAEYEYEYELEKSSQSELTKDIIVTKGTVENNNNNKVSPKRQLRRRSFIMATERLAAVGNVSAKKKSKKDENKRKFYDVQVGEPSSMCDSKIIVDQEAEEENPKNLFPLFNKKTKTNFSPKKSKKKLALDSVVVKSVELIQVEDDLVEESLEKKEVLVLADTWENTKRDICSEKDLAPFEYPTYFDSTVPDEFAYSQNVYTKYDESSYVTDINHLLRTDSVSFLIHTPNVSEEVISCQADSQVITLEESGTLNSNVPAEIYANLLWTDRYRPKTLSDFVGDLSVANRLKGWLSRWKQRLQSKLPSSLFEVKMSPKKKRKINTSDDDSDYNDEDFECNTIVLKGPVGVGKTCLVYCLAEELGFNVIDINCSSRRSYKEIVANHIGATHSHRIDLQQMQASKNDIVITKSAPLSPVKMKKSKNDIRSFFVKQKSSPAKLVTSSPPVVRAAIDFPKSNAVSLILIDDVDVLFEDDENFWNGIRDLTADCQVPVILTSAEMDLPGIQNLNVSVEEFLLTKISKKMCVQRLAIISKQENLISSSDDDLLWMEKLEKLASKFDNDLRACINHLQFWSLSLQGVNNVDLEIASSDVKPLNLHNSARILDGFSDKRCKTYANLDHAIRALSNEDGYSQGRLQLKCLRQNLSNRYGACESNLAQDYLPYLRQIVNYSLNRAKERRRFRPYLHKIGLDDKWGTVQNVLQKSVFNERIS